MQDKWLYFMGVILLIHSTEVGMLHHRGFRFAGMSLSIPFSIGAPISWIAGFFVGPWWAPIAVIPSAVILNTVRLFLIDAMTKGAPEAAPVLRVYSALLSGFAGAACIGWWLL